MFYFHVSDIPVCLHNTCCEYPRHLCHMWLEKAENLRHIWDSFDQQIIPFAPEWPVPPAAGWWSGVVVQGFSFTSTILSICNGTCPTCRWLSHSRLGIVQSQIKGGSYQICLVIPPIFHERHSYLSLGSLLLHGSEVFRRRLLLDPDLVGVTHIIFDEVWGPRVGPFMGLTN